MKQTVENTKSESTFKTKYQKNIVSSLTVKSRILMFHEKKIKRGNGDKVIITTWVSATSYGLPEYTFDVHTAKKGKRKFELPYKMWQLEQQPSEQRAHWKTAKYLEYVTREEIEACFEELYKKLHPRLNLTPLDHPDFL